MRSLPLALALFGCQPADDVAAPPPDREPAPSLTWKNDCLGDGVDCTVLQMPYDHADPDAGTFPMKLARAKHRFNVNYKGVILMNFGGPGADGTGYVPWFAQLFDELRDDYDLVSFDVRGGGYAPDGEPLGCMADLALTDTVYDAYDGSTDPADLDGMIETAKVWFDGCRETNPELVDHMGMNSWADDMDVIREALGVEKLSYYGASAGTGLGITYADRHPDRVDRFVLDSTAQAYGGMYEIYQTQLDGIPVVAQLWIDWCAEDPTCAVHDDPKGAMEAVLAEATADPLDVDGRPLTWGRAAYGIAVNFYNEAAWPWLGELLAAARDGDGAPLMESSDGYFGRSEEGFSTLTGISNHVWCADNTKVATAAEIGAWADADAARTGLSIAKLGALDTAWCAGLPAPSDPVVAPSAVSGAPPMLMLQSRNDVATPLPGALRAQQVLDNGSVMVIREGNTHVVLPESACVLDHAVAYFADGALPSDGTVCE